eukprot:2107745-Pyramimonas_sp.AAC.1
MGVALTHIVQTFYRYQYISVVLAPYCAQSDPLSLSPLTSPLSLSAAAAGKIVNTDDGVGMRNRYYKAAYE